MPATTILGAGGIGCAVGYALRSAGWPVRFVDADTAKINAGRREGTAVAGHAPQSAEFITFDDWRPTAGERILLCTKCYDNAAVLAKLPADAELLPIQNGFDAQLDARLHPAEGIASFVSECEPGRPTTRITRPGDLHLGPRHGLAPAWLGELAAALRSARLFRVREVAAILPYKHTKLMYNAAISPLAAAAGLDNGQLLTHPHARRLFFALLRENGRILRTAGRSLATIGPLPPRLVSGILTVPGLARLLAPAFVPSLRGTYCSMSGDIVRGRTEIDHYNGYLLQLAGDQPAPLNRQVVALVAELARRCAEPSLSYLDALIVEPRGRHVREAGERFRHD